MPDRPPCPHGDLTCPCQDGDSCHYEWSPHYPGLAPMRCWNRPPIPLEGGDLTLPDGSVVTIGPLNHCHVEGCRWEAENCGLAKLGIRAESDPTGVGWACGARRAAEAIMASLGW